MTLSDKRIIEIREIVSVYEVSIEGVEPTLKIKIEKHEGMGFMGVANLEVKGKGCAGFYRSLAINDTKEQAFEDAVTGFFAFYSDEAEVRKVKDW